MAVATLAPAGMAPAFAAPAPAAKAAEPALVATIPDLAPSPAAAIAAALRALPAQPGLPADTRKQADDLLQQAQADDAQADATVQQWQALEAVASGADAQAQKIEQALGADASEAMAKWRASLPERPTVEQIESLLARERDAATDARAAVSALESELARQTTRPAQLRTDLAAAHAALDASQSALGAASKASPAALAQAQQLGAQAAQRLAQARIAVLNLENRSYEPRMRLLSAQLRERQRAALQAGQRAGTLENLLLDRTGAQVRALQARVQDERTEIDPRARTLIEAADANIALVARLADTVRDSGDLRTRKQAWDRAVSDTAQALKNTEDRLRIGGTNEAVGLILLAEKRKLQPLGRLRRQLSDLQASYAQTRIGLIDVREQLGDLGDLDGAATAMLARLPASVPPDRAKAAREGLYRLLATRAQVLIQLGALQTKLASAQGDAEQELRGLVDSTAKLDTLLDSRLLWTPSHAPVNADWLAELAGDPSGFFAPERWGRVARDAARQAASAPILAATALGVLVLLFALRWRAPAQLAAIAAPMRRIRSDRYRLTGAALLWSLLAAAPWPVALWLGAAAFRAVRGNNFAADIGMVLAWLAPFAFALAFVRTLCRENGLAQFHFRWPRLRRAALHTAAAWLALIILPTQFLVGLAMARNDAIAIDGYARALLVAALVGMAALSGWLLAPMRLWTARYTVLAEPLRLRQCTRVVLCGGFLVLAVLVLRGYFVTALALVIHVLKTLAALLAANVAYDLAARWLVLGERRLALQRMEQRQAAEGASTTEGGDAPREVQPEEVTLASVSAQTRRLLRALVVVACAAALLWIWSDVAPALTVLGNINVWASSDVIGGKTVVLNVSLRDVLEAVLVLVLTWIATRNLPGLIELSLLRRLHVDAPTRFAITSVTRYAIVFAGTVAGLAMLGLHWNNLQWLAAGFSVGLGFGLQEIFANFVSGLMVLFERPFRIGDTVTIGDVEGTVTRIRTRATTIVDWDNKEVIVPNKSFITERLTNWSLSNTLTRVVLRIGAAYSSDPREVRQLLLDIANAETLVAQEPAPTCWFVQISACTFDFDLRVFIADLGDRNRARDALYTRIAEVFREKNIEMAFPQTDVWFRNAMPKSPDQPAPSADAQSASKRA
ncbi:MAG: mechanosensitive ion channel [Proteobacteria bacterium]|nr:mechanosensitive ion channel [Pseudomonadota bacterium]